MLDRAQDTISGLQAIAPDPLPISGLLLGKPVKEVAELLPRLFNLCRQAQSLAVRMATGLPVSDRAILLGEIRDEHLLRLAVTLPIRLGMAPMLIRRLAPDQMANDLFGSFGDADTPMRFEQFVEAGTGIAGVLRHVRDAFSRGEACATGLSLANGNIMMPGAAVENSVAARHVGNPVLDDIATRFGRGPFWRVAARIVDLQAVLRGVLPDPQMISQNTAAVPAARGIYAIRVVTEAEKVVELTRITPTDHLLMQGGVMQQSLSTLPKHKRDLAELVVDILDPCVPVRLQEVYHA